MSTLTSANSVILIAVTGLFDTAQQLQGFTADDIFDTGSVTNAEVVMGLDGRLSSGWIPAAKVQTFSIQADSPSALFFDTWITAEEVARDKFRASGVITLPGLNLAYACANGVLTSYSVLPDAKKILQPRKFTITWESLVPAPI